MSSRRCGARRPMCAPTSGNGWRARKGSPDRDEGAAAMIMRRIVATALLGLWLAGLAAAAPAQVEGILRAQGYAVTVTNAGVSGDGSRQMLARFDRAIPAGTRVVILDIGGGMWNDARLHVDYAVGVADFTAMKAKLRARAIAIVDLYTNRGMPPQFIQPDHIHLTAEGH